MALPQTALIVDDEPHARTYVRLLLKELGVGELWEAADATQALDLFSQHHPEFVVLDMNLRTVTGLQVLEQIRAIDADVPIVILTAESALKTVGEAVRLGANGYLLKHADKEVTLQ